MRAAGEHHVCAGCPVKITGGDSVDGITVSLKDTGGDEKRSRSNGVFIAAGTLPATELFSAVDGLTFDAQGAIITDELCRTGVDGVYAAGDVRSKPLRQIVTAAADGAVAGFDIGNK